MRLQFVPRIQSADPAAWGECGNDSAIDLLDVSHDEWTFSIDGGGATLSVTSGYPTTDAAQVVIQANPSQRTLQRVNRLLEGSQFKLRSYHRADGEVRLHDSKAGKYLVLPQAVDFTCPSHFSLSEKPESRVKTLLAPYAAPAAPAAAPAAPVASDPAPAMLVAPATATDLLQRPEFNAGSEVKVKKDVVEGLDMLWDLHTSGKRQVVCFIGPTGTGKTSLVYNLAARQKVGIFNFDCAGAREFSDFVGVTHLRGTETTFIPSALLEVIRLDGPYAGQPRIVNLDEVTRAESAQSLNALISMLHDFARINVPEAGRAYDLDPAVMYTFTANRGAQYTGTVGLDLALANRVTAWVKMEYADAKVEQQVLVERTGIEADAALRLVGAAQRIRDMDERGELPEGGGISTRLLIKAAEKVVAGFTLHAAASWTWVGNYSDEGGTQSEAYQVTSAIDLSLR